MTVQAAGHDAPKAGFSLYDPKLRGIAYQVVMLVVLVALVWTASSYAVANMARLGIPLNFNFWNQTAGFEINQTLVPYSALSSYGQAFWVGLFNTLLVGAFGVVLEGIVEPMVVGALVMRRPFSSTSVRCDPRPRRFTLPEPVD